MKADKCYTFAKRPDDPFPFETGSLRKFVLYLVGFFNRSKKKEGFRPFA